MVKELRSMRPWLAVILFASLGLNLFLVGIFGGHWLVANVMHHRRAEPAHSLMDRMAASLPPPYRATFEETVAKHRPTVDEAAASFREARTKVREALLREPFDRAAVDAAFTDLRARNETLQMAIQAAIADAAARLPADARERLVNWRAGGRRRP